MDGVKFGLDGVRGCVGLSENSGQIGQRLLDIVLSDSGRAGSSACTAGSSRSAAGSTSATAATTTAATSTGGAGEERACAALNDHQIIQHGGDLGSQRGEFIVAGAKPGLNLRQLILTRLLWITAESATAAAAAESAATVAAAKSTTTGTRAGTSTTKSTTTAATAAAATKSAATAAESATAGTTAAATLRPSRACQQGHHHDRREAADCLATQHIDLLRLCGSFPPLFSGSARGLELLRRTHCAYLHLKMK
jgi:hypothetical protein